MSNFYLNKIFIEARYNSALYFNDMDKLQSIIDKTSKYFSLNHYDTNTKTLILINQKEHLNVNISDKRFIIDMDEPKAFEEFGEVSNDIIKSITETLSISKLTRIGMRSFVGIYKKNYGAADNYVRRNFIKIDDKSFNILGKNIRDIGVSFSFNCEDYKILMNIKPNTLKITEIENNTVKRNETKYQVLIDSDVFEDGNIEADKLCKDFIKDVIKINNENINNFIRDVSIY